MALSKLDADSIDLADDYAFTGTVTGAGGTPGLVHLSTQTLASDASEVAFNSLIDTSTYTNYKVVAQGHITGDGNHVRAVFRDSSDADITATNYYRGRVTRAASVGNSTYMQITPGVGGVGPPEVGFSLDLNLNLINQAANTSIMPALFGTYHYVQTNENNAVDNPMWFMRPDYVTTDVAGIRFYASSGNFEAGSKFVLYGLAES